MARTYSWSRVRKHTQTYDSINSIDLDIKGAGYTLMKTRFGVRFIDETGYNFAHLLRNPSTFGIIMMETGTMPNSPSLAPDDPWIWWEGIHTLPYQQTIPSPPYSPSFGPLPYEIRVSDSRRIAPALGATMWITWDFLDPYIPPLFTQFFAIDIWAEFLWLSPGP